MAEVRPPNRVLVVDGHEDSADSLAKLLELRGYESAVAYDGLQAIELLARQQTDADQRLADRLAAALLEARPVVVLDTGCPGLD